MIKKDKNYEKKALIVAQQAIRSATNDLDKASELFYALLEERQLVQQFDYQKGISALGNVFELIHEQREEVYPNVAYAFSKAEQRFNKNYPQVA